MTPEQTAALLAYAVRLDPRLAITDEDAADERLDQWCDLLADVPATAPHPDGHNWDAAQAVRHHIASSPYRIQPSDISRPWHTFKADIIGRHTGTFEPTDHPEINPDDPTGDAYVAALRAERRAVATGRRMPTSARAIAPAVSQADVSAMRQQKDLARFIKDTGRQAAARCAARRAAVLRHPDLTERLHDLLGPGEWNGYLAPEEWGGRTNDSPIRRKLAEIVAEAEARAEGRTAA
ncbi:MULTISPECIES: hypothetical protein [Streptomyces]|uniref:Cell surface glycoprotein n=2 Tax=Streptomyces TaxID=1883 RepID=A0A100Y646_9ACTN|nr:MULTISPECIES: hypothetical protein [Streptomyces]KUH38412.1 hypothetical protein ATE80_13160 [Streptomyces kanasensis]UUS30859.1 cell surface glycoprotein [Streptomyces changanensis]